MWFSLGVRQKVSQANKTTGKIITFGLLRAFPKEGNLGCEINIASVLLRVPSLICLTSWQIFAKLGINFRPFAGIAAPYSLLSPKYEYVITTWWARELVTYQHCLEDPRMMNSDKFSRIMWLICRLVFVECKAIIQRLNENFNWLSVCVYN